MFLKTLKAHVSNRALAVVALGLLIPTGAHAQGSTPVFAPSSSWQVGATELSNVRGLEGVKLPCVLSNEYDNGFIVRFSGGGEQILAMAVDFRQAIFVRGRQYNAMVSIGDDYAKQVTASAFTDSTLIFNVRPLKGFYQILQKGKSLGLDIDGNVMKFGLGELKASIPLMERCHAGEVIPVIKPPPSSGVQAAAVVPVEREEMAPLPMTPPAPQKLPEFAPVQTQPLPKNMNDIVKAPVLEPNVIPVVRAPVSTQAKIAVQENVAAPIPRGPEAVVAAEAPKPAPLNIPAPAPVSVPKPVENAAPVLVPAPVAAPIPAPVPVPVQKTVSDGAPTKISPLIEDDSISKRPSSLAAGGPRVSKSPDAPVNPAVLAQKIPPVPQLVLNEPVKSAPVAPAKPASVKATGWRAKAGEDMKVVLKRWADQAGYNFDWQSPKDVIVAQDIMLDGSFEDAVAQLIATNGAATGLSGRVQTVEGDTRSLSGAPVAKPLVSAPQPIAKSPVKAVAAPSTSGGEWKANKGANARNVLSQWSSRAGVTLVWNAAPDYVLKAPVGIDGGYEAAVQSLLDQYMDDSRRPVGRLNTDPITGKRTLTINTDKAS